jgi:hypothetical protein
MAQVIIKHPDGRRYEVSEKAFEDLYAPFGFEVESVIYNGAALPATEANLAKANEGTAAPSGDTSAENRARAVILSDLEASARQRLTAEAPVNTSNMEVITPGTNADTGSNAGNATPVSSAKADGSAKASGTGSAAGTSGS